MLVKVMSGVKNKLLDFTVQAKETANVIHNLIKFSLDTSTFDTKNLSMIWGFHGGDHEECRLLGRYAMWLL
jgi:hypothetical protein